MSITHAAPTSALSPTLPVCSNTSCTGSYTHRDECECTCGGSGHGLRYRIEAQRGATRMAANTVRHGAFHRLPTHSDDEGAF